MGVADQQIIAGQQYTMYTPAWYAAREAEQARQANLSAKTAADAKVTALNEITPALKGLMGGFGVTTSTGAMAPGVAGTGGAAQLYTQPGAPGAGAGTGTGTTGTAATTPGNDAMYAAAKDKIGNQMRSSLMALRDSASEGGQFAAGGQNPALQGATERLISRGQGEMGDVARQQAAQQAAAAAEADKMRLASQLGLTSAETMAGVNNSYDLQQLQAKNAADMQRQLLSSLFGLFGSGGLY